GAFLLFVVVASLLLRRHFRCLVCDLPRHGNRAALALRHATLVRLVAAAPVVAGQTATAPSGCPVYLETWCAPPVERGTEFWRPIDSCACTWYFSPPPACCSVRRAFHTTSPSASSACCWAGSSASTSTPIPSTN